MNPNHATEAELEEMVRFDAMVVERFLKRDQSIQGSVLEESLYVKRRIFTCNS